MTAINEAHVEWALVGRLRLMLDDPPNTPFNVTQTYALFTTILCWVMQRIRIRPDDIAGDNDEYARRLFTKFETEQITDDPWQIHAAPTPRIARVGGISLDVPSPENFADHDTARFLKNLRDATAHGDARTVKPFHVKTTRGANRLLAGFRFNCEEARGRGKSRAITWAGSITLLEDDLRRIGSNLARRYCDALRRTGDARHDSNFGSDAADNVVEIAA